MNPQLNNTSSDNDANDSDDEPLSSIATAYQNPKSNLIPMPDVLPSKMSKEFELDDIYSGIEITSLDITTHGCTVIAGCSNGMIFLFDVTSPSR